MKTEIKQANILIKHKWIALFAFIIFMALSAGMIDYVRHAKGVSPTFLRPY